MRLFLSSYRAGNYEAEFLDLLDGVKKMAYISNAKDYKSSDDRKVKIEENTAYWRSIGLTPTEVDLRPYFHKPGADKLLDDYEFVWLAGGNTFLLRRALKYTGLDKYLVKRAKEGSIIYGGESAGAIMAAPTLRGSEDPDSPDHEDDPNYTPKPYEKEVLWNGLGLLDFVLVPHYKSSDVGASIDSYIDYLKKHKTPYKTIGEEGALIMDRDRTEILK